jgi:hypothetical protein
MDSGDTKEPATPIPNYPDQEIESGAGQSGGNASQPYMTDAVVKGGDAAAQDQSKIQRKMYDENGDPLFTDDYNMAQEHRDREGDGEGRVKDTDLEYQQGGDTSDETGDPIFRNQTTEGTPHGNKGQTPETERAKDESVPLDQRLSGNQR